MTFKSPVPDATLDADLAVIDLDKYRQERRASYCSHDAMNLDPNNRTLTCRTCNTVLDHFDALMRLTREWARVRELAGLRKRLLAHIEELNRLTANARAKARRAGVANLPEKPC